MFNSDTFANRPAFGIVGRIFISIDTSEIFRDTGTSWVLIADGGGTSTNIYNSDGTLTGNRTISSGGFQLVFNPQTTFFSSLIPSTSASSFAVLGSNTLTFAAGFNSSNIGNVYSANGAINAQIFSGNATFAQANLASAMVNVNKIDFSSGGHSITMTQSTAPGIRAITGVQNQIQFTGSHNGTISHSAISQNLGFFRESGSTRTLTITNAYSLLLNPLDDYGSGFIFTNRWGIYQAGTTDKNYFAAHCLLGSNTDNGNRLQVNGNISVNNLVKFSPLIGFTQIGVSGSDFNIYNGTETEIRLTINNSGNCGVGIAPSAWANGLRTIDIGFGSALVNANSFTSTWLTSNCYYTTQWIYKNTSPASYYEQASGQHFWYIAPSGTAGNPITFSQAMTIDSNGRLGIGATSMTYSLQVNDVSSGNMFKFSSGTTILDYYVSGGNPSFGTASNNSLGFRTNDVVRILVKSTGIINLSNVPASSVGLVSGDIYQNAGVLNIVP
jgi:hypothetical protein